MPAEGLLVSRPMRPPASVGSGSHSSLFLLPHLSLKRPVQFPPLFKTGVCGCLPGRGLNPAYRGVPGQRC